MHRQVKSTNRKILLPSASLNNTIRNNSNVNLNKPSANNNTVIYIKDPSNKNAEIQHVTFLNFFSEV